MAKKKDKKQNPGQVVFSVSSPHPPLPHEIDVAWVLAYHYRSTVEFITPIDDYKRKTADIVLHGVVWEIKCPTGKSKSTISNQIRRASRQSAHIIIDTRHTKLQYSDIEKRVIFGVSGKSDIKKVILIDKLGKVVEIKK